MKVIDNWDGNELKEVKFFNLTFYVDKEVKYLCSDKVGDVTGFNYMPIKSKYGFWCNTSNQEEKGNLSRWDVGCVNLEGINWEDTLVEV